MTVSASKEVSPQRPQASKPLGHRSYGSIPHLPGSRVGPGDRHIHEGQARIACKQARDCHDHVVITEKLDGSNVGIARIGDAIVPLTRSGYHALDSHFEQHHYFARWTAARERQFRDLLSDGERIAGEWLLQAHGTRYRIEAADELFVAFDILSGTKRLAHDAFTQRCRNGGVRTVAIISSGQPMSIEAVLEMLGDDGFHNAIDLPEGAVWRVERNGQCDFLAKFVRHDKKDGCFLPEVNGTPPIWNWPPDAL